VKYDSLCEGAEGVGWWAPIYFVTFVIISAMVLVSLLIAGKYCTYTAVEYSRVE
jgi:hypothetical protein